MSKVQKIAIASFFAGAVCYLMTKLLGIQYLPLGILSGVATGYLGYEFRTVLHAVWIAFQEAFPMLYRKLRAAFLGVIGGIRRAHDQHAEWERVQKAWAHPCMVLNAMILCAWSWFVVYPLGVHFGNRVNRYPWERGPEGFEAVMWGMFVPIMGTIILVLLLCGICGLMVALAGVGSCGWKGCHWHSFVEWFKSGKSFLISGESRFKDGLLTEPASYTIFLLWVLVGIAMYLAGILRWIGFFLWALLELGSELYVACRDSIPACKKFVYRVFVLIHSDERIICAIYGTFGGLISLGVSYSSTTSVLESALFALCGGALGAAIAVSSHKFISRKLLGNALS